MDDSRAHSPTDHVLAGIELLRRLSLLGTDSMPWIEPEAEWSHKLAAEPETAVPFGLGE